MLHPNKKKIKSLDELDPEMKKTFDKLGISLDEQKISRGSCRFCDG